MYAIYGNMDPINISPMLAYIPYMDPMGYTDDVFMQMPFFGDFPASHVWLPAGLAFEASMH